MRLLSIIQKAGVDATLATDPVEITLGTVTSINPLIITVEQKMPIESNFLILTDHVRDYQTEISFDDPNVEMM